MMFTVTGRFSSAQPTMWDVARSLRPMSTAEALRLRDAFRRDQAELAGKLLEVADYTRLEQRVIAQMRGSSEFSRYALNDVALYSTLPGIPPVAPKFNAIVCALREEFGSPAEPRTLH